MITISELSRAFGLAVSTLRYDDDDEGIVPARARSGNVRVYAFEDAVRLAYVRLLHEDGMLTLAQTRAALQAQAALERRAVFGDAAAALRSRIERLQVALHVIEHQADCTASDSQSCPVTGRLLRRRAREALGAR